MKIHGGIGSGELGFINVNFISTTYNIHSTVRFYIDTGCSVTTLSPLDARRIGINIDILPLSKVGINGMNGIEFPRIISNCSIIFTNNTSSLLETIGNAYILDDNCGKKQNITPISLLGLDVLKRFKISFAPNGIILEK